MNLAIIISKQCLENTFNNKCYHYGLHINKYFKFYLKILIVLPNK